VSKGKIALVQDTGEILEIKDYIMTMSVKISFPDEYRKVLEDVFKIYPETEDFQIDEEKSDDISISTDNRVDKYILSNNKQYYKNELIIGIDNIRNYNLQNILNNGI
jgi:hypothetical protein